MFIYNDTLGNKVTIYFEAQENNPDDVLIIPKTEDGWLFTEHKIRGLDSLVEKVNQEKQI